MVALSTAACSGIVSRDGTSALFTTPSSVITTGQAGPAGERSVTLARDVVTFTLANGTFKFTSPDGELTGTYTGFVTAPTSGRPRMTITLQVTGGSGAFVGATGTLVGEGKGAFVTGGDFVLSVGGMVRTSAAPSASKFHTTVVGTATLPLTCSSNNHRISRLRGEGTIPTAGRARMELDSEIVETNCL